MREVLQGFEDAPIGFDFEREPEADLRAAVTAAIDELRRTHPSVTIMLRFGGTE